MSIEVARYQFHSWARKGIATRISAGDDLGASSDATLERAEVNVGVTLNSAAHQKGFALIGAADIVGINPKMIVRTEPRDWITDFEPNYLAFVEFYDEDFPWRYTPAAPVGSKLRPWLFLLVLAEDEFERTKRQVPLPSITVKNNNAFPPATETWMWAHVHSNANIPDSELSDFERFLASLNRMVNDDPDQIYSRLLSPRKLAPNTAYHAFVIPAFETGRLAGLEQPTATVPAQMPSWDNNGPKGEMPFYYEWYFRTSINADFESLVKLLEPRAMDPRVGIRDMDCSRPGFVRADDDALELPGTRPPLLGLEGALKAPTTESSVFPDPDVPNEFQPELEKIVNLPFTILGTDDSGDPLISVPLYGGKHAKKSTTDVVRLDISKSTWVNELNKDPRQRVPAGFGTLVVQKNQELYMKKAWEQVTKIIEANRRINATLLNMKVALRYTTASFQNLQQNVLLAMSRPVLPRIMGSPTTVFHQIGESRLPAAVFSGAFRRMVRPNGKFIKKLSNGGSFRYDQLVTDINEGRLTAAPPKEVPAGLPNTEDMANQIFPRNLPPWLLSLLKHRNLVLLILLLIFLILALITGAYVLFLTLAVLAVAAYIVAGRFQQNSDAADVLKDPEKQAEVIRQVPPRSNFTLVLSDELNTPPPTPTTAGADSVEARNFRTALTDLTGRLVIKAPVKEVQALDLRTAYTKVATAIHPHVAFPLRLNALVAFPAYIPLQQPEQIFEAMAYPDFEDPMYKKLVDISQELLLPNLKLIPQNTISLLKTNQKFIESYLVGLNHEMGRELLWREYPTDERGSYFRQFWDVKGLIQPQQGKTEAQTNEAYKDIPPIHRWSINSVLGSHNNRDAEGDAEQTVLIIRGDLLKRYPNTVIFVQKAIAGSTPEEHVIDQDLTAEEFRQHVKFPLYKAELPPDIQLFGFDLTIEQARGTEPSSGFSDNLGWFFVIQQVPGEPRFGMDITFDQGSDGLSWDDLAWTNLPADLTFIKAGVRPTLHPTDDFRWGADSANMAFVLFQKPSMVAVHASEMLEQLKNRNTP